MSRLLAVLAAAIAALPLTAAADAPTAAGRIEVDDAHVEILGQPVRVGEKIVLPEGWIRVEEKGTEDEQVGSFTVLPAETFAEAAPAPSTDEPSAGDPAPTVRRRDCRPERAAYFAELWRQSGIDVRRPDALIEGLEGTGTGPNLGFYWFALATDPFRPLAWNSPLRDRAEALSRCVLGN